MTAEAIPIVDVGDLFTDVARRNELARRLTTICHEIGFAVITNHGLEPSLLAEVFEWTRAFFDLDDADKSTIDKLSSPHFRGWEAVGSEFTNNRPDMREQIDIWTSWPPRDRSERPDYLRLHGPNQWPTDNVMPGLEALMSRWYSAMGGLADLLLGTLCLGMGLEEDHLRSVFGDEPMSLTKLIHYPPTPDGAAGVNAHHDAGFLTILAPGDTPGLQVQMPSGSWIDVPQVDGGLVLNLGENLQAMTSNYLVATPHRVITAEERLSAGYFHGPSLGCRLEPLPLGSSLMDAVAASPRHRDAGFMARRHETEAGVGDMQSDYKVATYGEQLWNYFARSYPKNMALHHADLVER